MRRISLLIISISFFSITNLFALNLPAYPFEFAYSLYSGDKVGEVNNFLHVNAGVRFEIIKFMYFDLFFKGNLLFNIDNQKGVSFEIEKDENNSFFNASLNFPSIMGKRISLSLFLGRYDALGSDSILKEYIKSSAASPLFMQHYPANVFRPDLDIKGAGVALYGATQGGLYTGFYSYWNMKPDDNFIYANDFRFGFAYSTFSFETFISFLAKKIADDFRMRLGIMGSVKIEDYELFFEMGFAKLAPHKLSLKEINSQFYVLFEPRIKKRLFNISTSFFMASPFQLPKDLNNNNLNSIHFLGLNVLLGFGNLEEHKINGGISILTAINILDVTEITPFTFSLAPFITVATSKLEFDFRIPINPLLYKNLRRAITAQFSMKAAY